MNLKNLSEQNPAFISNKNVEQLVAMCGDGKLKDNSECSRDFREFLTTQSLQTLKQYTDYCLETKLEKGGLILQDVVNEMGRKIGYEVINGRYSGVRNDIGFDGLWFDGENYIIVEVKTTDAYRINLDTILAYADKKAKEDTKSSDNYTALIVVGRQDTGDLEAQIRGSRHAWRARLISIESLSKLMYVSRELNEPSLNERIRKILLPFEYTRVDEIVDLVFETHIEVEQKQQAEDHVTDKNTRENSGFEFTPREQLNGMRELAINSFAKSHSITKISQAQYSIKDIDTNIVCSVSKRYPREGQPYWYAFHPNYYDFLKSSKNGYLILACMDKSSAYALPISLIISHIDDLNQTKLENRHYWHIALCFDEGKLSLNLSKIGIKINIEEYAFNLDGGSA